MPGSYGEHVACEITQGVARLTLRRPPANVLDIPMLRQLKQAVADLAQDPGLRVLLLAAEGKSFSAGVDVADHTPERVGHMLSTFDGLCRDLDEFPVPTIAVVQGHALGGGCEIALCCDFVIMANGARIGQPEIRLAALAPVAALRLSSLVGDRWAARLLLVGEPIEAEQAAAIGLITRNVPADGLASAVGELADKLASLSRAALRLNKRALRLGRQDWARNLPAVERLYLDELMQTEDAQEGLQAFLSKRDPVWRHR